MEVKMAKRRSNNEGTIHQRKDGSWRAQITLEGKRLSHSAKTERECQEWRKKINIQKDNGLTIAGAQTCLGEYLEKWLQSIRSNLADTTWYQYNMYAHKCIIPLLGNVKLKDIHVDHLQNLYLRMTDEGYKSNTVRIVHAILHKSLKYALVSGLIIKNPADLVQRPRVKEKEMNIFSESQVSQFLISVKGTRNEALYQLELATGLRQSEILGLKWSDLDWLKGSLNIERQLKRNGKNKEYFTKLKTRASRRTILLGKKTVLILKEHLERQAIEQKVMGTRWQENDMLFPSSIGTPMNQSNLYKNFKDMIQNAGLPNIRFHDLRHTAASIMLNHNIPIIVVSRRLGHSKASITLDIYGHLMHEMQDEVANLIDDLITPTEVAGVELHQNCTEKALPNQF
jgi:integrase